VLKRPPYSPNLTPCMREWNACKKSEDKYFEGDYSHWRMDGGNTYFVLHNEPSYLSNVHVLWLHNTANITG